MKRLKFLSLFVIASLSAFTSFSQLSRAETQVTIDSLLPSNSLKLITAARTRDAFRKILDYVEPSNIISNFQSKSIPLLKLSQNGATTGQAIVWNGSQWSPASVSSSSPLWGSITGSLASQSDLQSALNGKSNATHTHSISELTQSGATSGQIIKWNGTSWVAAADATGGASSWGSITGTLSSQSDLNSALSGKEPLISIGGLALNKISLSGASEGNVLKISGGALTYAADATGASAGLTTVANLAALKTFTTATDGQIVATAGYYTKADEGQGMYVWNAASTATADDGLIVQVTGISTGRFFLLHNGRIHARQYGAKGDGSTDDTARLQAALNGSCVNNTLELFLGNGVFKTTSTLTIGTASPSSLPSKEKCKIIGAGPTFDPNTTSPAFTTGTAIAYFGTGNTGGVIDIKAGAGRYLHLQDFSVICNTTGGAEYGIVWSSQAISQHSLTRVHSHRANKAFGQLTGGYANGEFIKFDYCQGTGVTHFFYMQSTTGQAFNHHFDHCLGSVTGDGGAIFEIGGGGLGFAITLTDFSSSNPFLSPFSSGTGVTFMRSNGISGIVSATGGRIEQVSTIFQNTQGTNNIQGKFVFRDMHFAGLQSNSTRNFINTTSNNSAFELLFENCIFSPLEAQVSNTAVNIIWNNYNESELKFKNCNFSNFPSYYVSIAETTKTRVIFDDCQKSNVSVAGKIRFSKYYGYNYPSGAAYAYKPQNFLLQSGFTSSFGGVAATSPWVMGVNSTFDNIQGQAGHTGGYSTDSRFRQFALKANSNVCQTISAFNFGSGTNDYNYRAYISLHNGVNSPFRLELVNSSTGKVYDRIDLKGANSNGDILQVDLHANGASSDGGNVKVCLVNRNTDWPMNVNLFGQHAFTNPSASYVETTTTAVDSPFVLR